MTTVQSDCETCRRLHRNQPGRPPTCDAFPDGIPIPILFGHPHDKPYPGDRGMQYLPDPERVRRKEGSRRRTGPRSQHLITVYGGEAAEPLGTITITMPERAITFGGRHTQLMSDIWNRWVRRKAGDTQAVLDDLTDFMSSDSQLSYDHTVIAG